MYSFVPPAIPGLGGRHATSHSVAPRRCRPLRRRLAIVRCVSEPSATPDSVRALITSKTKEEQQRGLLLVRKLPPAIALELLLLSVETSQNEFIRSTAAIGLGQLDTTDAAIRSGAIDAMVHLLATDHDYSVRAAAAAGMGYVSGIPQDSLVALMEALSRALLEDSEWQVHFSCLTSLGALHDKRAVPTLLRWLSSDNDLLVQSAVGALGDIGDSSVVPDLLNLLGCEDMMTRQRLAQSLGHMPQCREELAVIDALRTLSRDQSYVVREAATESLRTFGCGDPAKADSLSNEERIDLEVANLMAGDEAGNAGVTASSALRRRLERSFDKEYVHDPASMGGATGTAEVEESSSGSQDAKGGSEPGDPAVLEYDYGLTIERYQQLLYELKHGDVSAQTMASIRLRKYSGELALEAALSSDALNPAIYSQRVRAVSVSLLTRGGALGKVIEVLQTDPDQNVRSACCDALLDLGSSPNSVSACISAFESDPHWLVRISAAITLGTIGKGSTEVESVLINSLRSGGVVDLGPPQDSVVQRHAVTALGFLGSQKALAAFSQLLASGEVDTAVRFRIAAALRGIHCAESVTLVRSLVNDSDDEVAEMAQGSLDALAQQGFQ